jgi:hypothetical protein
MAVTAIVCLPRHSFSSLIEAAWTMWCMWTDVDGCGCRPDRGSGRVRCAASGVGDAWRCTDALWRGCGRGPRRSTVLPLLRASYYPRDRRATRGASVVLPVRQPTLYAALSSFSSEDHWEVCVHRCPGIPASLAEDRWEDIMRCVRVRPASMLPSSSGTAMVLP